NPGPLPRLRPERRAAPAHSRLPSQHARRDRDDGADPGDLRSGDAGLLGRSDSVEVPTLKRYRGYSICKDLAPRAVARTLPSAAGCRGAATLLARLAAARPAGSSDRRAWESLGGASRIGPVARHPGRGRGTIALEEEGGSFGTALTRGSFRRHGARSPPHL